MAQLSAEIPKKRILVIEDDLELCDLLKEYLESEIFDVEFVTNGKEGLNRALEGDHALVILDVRLPGMNGFEVLRTIRTKSDKPVVVLSARGEDIDRIIGFEIGADDYLPKPFNPRELLVRIKAILRRSGNSERPSSAHRGPSLLSVGDVTLHMGTRSVTRNGEPVDLTAVEYDLLEVLIRSAGDIVLREQLFRKVLDRESSPMDRSLDMHVSKLRKKLGTYVSSGQQRIKTIRGVGYMYCRLDDSD